MNRFLQRGISIGLISCMLTQSLPAAADAFFGHPMHAPTPLACFSQQALVSTELFGWLSPLLHRTAPQVKAREIRLIDAFLPMRANSLGTWVVGITLVTA